MDVFSESSKLLKCCAKVHVYMYIFAESVPLAIIILIELTDSKKLRASHIAYKCQYCDCLVLLA